MKQIQDDRLVYSNMMRAGQRIYYFDVKMNKKNDYYLIITESKKLYNKKGTVSFDKHKIQLYHENVTEFMEIFKEMSNYLITHNSGQEDLTPMN